LHPDLYPFDLGGFGQHSVFEVVDDILQLTSPGTVEAGASISEQVLENRIIGLHIWTRHDLVCAGSYSAVRLCCPHLSRTLDDLDCNLLIVAVASVCVSMSGWSAMLDDDILTFPMFIISTRLHITHFLTKTYHEMLQLQACQSPEHNSPQLQRVHLQLRPRSEANQLEMPRDLSELVERVL
jgi:hypothetical protein